jgi:hypothetical protein
MWDEPDCSEPPVVAYFIRQQFVNYAVEQSAAPGNCRIRVFWPATDFGSVSLFAKNATGTSSPAVFDAWVFPKPISICVAFFSPCNYELPKQHLAKTLEWIAAENAETILAQVVLPGQKPQPSPANVQSLVYESSDVMFYKENLWNLAARKATGEKLLFVDSDVRIVCSDLAKRVCRLLDTVDICQPFDNAVWLSQTGMFLHARPPAAVALAKGDEPVTRFYHPGFSWAMTRQTFNRLNGFYDRDVVGGGDIAFAYSLDKRWHHVNLKARTPNDAQFSNTPHYRRYRERGVNLNLRVGYLENVPCQHLWHGEFANRQYTQRGKYCPVLYGEDFPLTYRDDGLLAWTSNTRSHHLQNYFLSRREDG